MKRNLRLLIVALLCAANAALGVVLWRSPDPGYRIQEILAFGRYSEHDGLIAEAAKKHGVDPLLVKSVVWRESRFSPAKVGTSGERGLMQVGEAAARDWAAANKVDVFVFADLFDARTNLDVGTWYLGRAFEYWKDRDFPVYFALAEYNAGRSRVEKWAADGASARVMLRAASAGSAGQYVEDIVRRYRLYLPQDR